MKKQLFLKNLLVLIGVLIGSLTTQMWAAYYVTGSTATVGSWNPAVAANQMTQVGTTSTYYKTFANFNEADTKIKVTNGSWDQTWGAANIQTGADISLSDDGTNDHNIQINGNPNKTITVWFNQTNNKVWVTGADYATQTVYVIGENSWTDANVKAHIFLGDAAYYQWASDQTMTKVSTISRAGITYKVYSYTFPNGYKGAIFRYGTGDSDKTGDLEWSASNPYYSTELSAWFASTADALAKYLVGTNWTDASWDHTDAANKMTDNGDGSYSKNISISDASKLISLKISRKGTWTGAFDGDASGTGHNLSVDFGKDGSSNLTFKVAHAGTTKITLTSTGKINVDAPYQVSYAAGTGATGTVSASAVTTYGSTCTLSSSTFSKTGYTQDGWSTSEGGSKAYDLGDTYTGGYVDVTLYPHWKANKYDVTLDPDNGGSTATVEATYNATMPSKYKNSSTSVAAPTFSGYSFQGYYDDHAGDGTQYYNSSASSARTWNKASTATLYAKWTQQITLDANTSNHGSGSNTTATTATWNATAVSNFAATSGATGYRVEGYYTGATDGDKVLTNTGAYAGNVSGYITSGKWSRTSTTTLYAHLVPKTYTITLNANGGTPNRSTTATYDSGTLTSWTAPEKEGYTLTGYFTATSEGTKVINDNGTLVANVDGYTDASGNWTKDDGCELHAQWTPNSYRVVFKANGGTGDDYYQSFTYDVADNLTANIFTKDGYHFDGWATASDGDVEYEDGEAVTNLATSGDFNLYAHWTAVTITGITLSPTSVAPSGTTTATAVFSPGDPTGNWHIDWAVKYSNDNPYATTITNSANSNTASITAPSSAGSYKIIASLKTGTTMNAGTEIDSYTKSPYTVSSSHTVAVLYKDQSGNTIKESGSVTIPAAGTAGAEAPSIFGYSFHHWVAGDGVTIETGTAGTEGEGGGSTSITISAVYDGYLTAVYSKKQMIYFKNTFGWSNVYFHNSYWDNSQGGAGNKGQTRNQPMNLVPGETDVYYWEGTPGVHVAFTNATYGSGTSGEGGYQAFWAGGDGAVVVFPSNPTCSSSANTYYGYNVGTPMFVPITQEGQDFNIKDGGKAVYYNKGYWRYYDPVRGEEGGTGYTLKIYNKTEDDGSRVELSSTSFSNADVSGQLFKATVNLEAAGGYGVKILRNNSMLYTKTDGHLHRTGDVVVTERGDDNYQAIWIKATAAGDYDFIITCNGDGKICLQATFPAKTGDYRVLYTDNATWSNGAHTAQTWNHPSRVISAEGNAVDTISFYVAKDNSPQYKIEKITGIDEGTGAITWTQVQGWTDISVDATGVYNFKITQNAAGDGISSVTNIGEYSGNYYIRTDCAGSTKWDNYKSPDHMMTYSEYSKEHSDYTHYYMKYVGSGTNVKFTIANDYSACISDTLITHSYRGGDAAHITTPAGTINANANIRFMWDIRYNRLIRAYLAEGQNDGSEFLVLCANSNTDMLDEGGNALLNSANSGQAGYNHKAPDNCMQFVDNENWIYEANIKIKPGAFVKLYAKFNNSYFYFKGENNNTFDKDNAIKLMDGTGDAELVRVIYDFKTDRLVAAWQPSGNIATERAINADVMFVREHQGDITQLTFTESGAITKITTAYAVLRFNKWTINNKSEAVGHAVLDPLLSRYERDLFYVSFPFKVAMNEVFGFGTYGVHWIIEEYDGAARAREGYWADSESFWKFVFDRRGKYFEPNQGYIIALDLDELGESSSVWDNGVETVELYFPSYGTMGDITNATVEYTLPEHTCTIGPRFEGGESRTIADSHWNVMSVPTYVNTSSVTFANTTWTAARPSFLYEWNSSDNSLTARSGNDYTYHAMHAYMVQYCGKITWTSTSVTPSSVAARLADTSDKEYKLELISEEKVEDQTFVRMTDNEGITSGFEFGDDLSKEMNRNRSNIWTVTSDTVKVAGNSQPHPLTTTIVPVGVKIAANGEYTFSMPEGTNGGDVWLIDNANNLRTNLGLMDYTVNLTTGTYEGRFSLEFPVQNVVTEIENAANANANANANADAVRKVFVGGQLYIIRDGVIYNASGARVQ